MPDFTRDAAFETLAATPVIVGSLLGAFPDDAVDAASDGSWSPKDVVAHLILAERNGAIGRIHLIVSEDDPMLPNRDEDAEPAASGLSARPVADLVAEFARVREDDVARLRSLGDDAWSRGGRHSAVGRVTAAEFLYHAAYHDCLHLSQLASMLQVRFEPHRGAMRAF